LLGFAAEAWYVRPTEQMPTRSNRSRSRAIGVETNRSRGGCAFCAGAISALSIICAAVRFSRSRAGTLRCAGYLVVLLFGSSIVAVGCRQDCAVTGHPNVRFASPSCCGMEPRYYWDHDANDCVELPQTGAVNCGCSCAGECARMFSSLDECRNRYSHCR
jgi:hypothetical protein